MKHWRLSYLKLQTTWYEHLKPEIKKSRKGFSPFFSSLWVTDVEIFIHKYTLKLLSLPLDWDISIIKETHSCESGKSSRLGTGRKHQAVYFISQIITSMGTLGHFTINVLQPVEIFFLNILFISTLRDCSVYYKHSYPKPTKHIWIYVISWCWKAIYHWSLCEFRVRQFTDGQVNRSMCHHC